MIGKQFLAGNFEVFTVLKSSVRDLKVEETVAKKNLLEALTFVNCLLGILLSSISQ